VRRDGPGYIPGLPGRGGVGLRCGGADGPEADPTRVGYAWVGSRSISARALRCSRRITTCGGMCGPTAPTALRRRSIRSSDRGRGFVFGSSLGHPGEHDDCLALSRLSSLLETPESRAAKGPPPGGASGSPIAGVLRDDGAGFDAASLEGAREWRADGHASGRDRPRRAVSPSCTRATAEGRREGARTTGRRSSERALGRERVSSEMRRDDVGNRTPSGVGPTRWTSPRGGSTGTPSVPRATVECGRGCSFGSRRSHRDRRGPPFGENPPSVAWSQTGPKHPAFPHVRVRGRRSGSGRQAKRPARAGRRDARQRRETGRSKAQGSIERSYDGNVARTQRTPRWSKALRSKAVQRGVATRKRVPLERREGTPSR
jgi:hypothetical protein